MVGRWWTWHRWPTDCRPIMRLVAVAWNGHICLFQATVPCTSPCDGSNDRRGRQSTRSSTQSSSMDEWFLSLLICNPQHAGALSTVILARLARVISACSDCGRNETLNEKWSMSSTLWRLWIFGLCGAIKISTARLLIYLLTYSLQGSVPYRSGWHL